jgi:hypothetical protein
MSILSESVFEQYLNLIKIEENIVKLYEKLKKLSLEGREDSDEYKKYVSYLDVSLTAENYVFEDIQQDEESVISLLSYLKSNFNISDLEGSLFDMALSMNGEFNPNLRVAIRLKRARNNRITKKAAELVEQSGISGTVLDTNNLIRANNNCFLLMLQDQINNPENSNHNYFICFSYAMAFLDPEVESTMLIKKETPKLEITECSDISEFIIQKLIDQINSDLIYDQISSICVITDKEYHNKEKCVSSIVAARQIYLRALLALSSDTIIQKKHDAFHELTDTPSVNDIFKNSNISVEIISKTFRSVKYDKEKYKLSMGDRKKN